MRLCSWFLGALALVGLCGEPARAFHEKGVAACASCHVMHGSQNGVPVVTASGEALLVGGTASDTCLRCHADYGQFAAGQGFGPGGDFSWLTRTWTWTTASGTAASSPGAHHGHSVVAPAYGLQRDPDLARAPGGTFLSQDLGCTSCHDPHGNGNFRLLYGAGDGPAVPGGRFLFTSPAPLARGNGPFTVAGLPGAGDETDERHTVYQRGMSTWCGNCHGRYHDEGGFGFKHPSEDGIESGRANTYNRYVSAEDPLGGSVETAWWGLVPIEAVSVDLAAVDPTSYTQGATPQDQVMCLTCHRAHASAFPVAGRWDFAAALIADSHPLLTDGGATAADVSRKYYGYTFVPTQDSLCHKCHREIPGGGASPFDK